MSVSLARETMKTLSVKLPEDVVTSARVVSAITGESIAVLLGRLLRDPLAKLEEEALDSRGRKPGAGESPKGKRGSK